MVSAITYGAQLICQLYASRLDALVLVLEQFDNLWNNALDRIVEFSYFTWMSVSSKSVVRSSPTFLSQFVHDLCTSQSDMIIVVSE